eukprot:8604918-Pyramimonas_sp.AAC.1
MEYEQRQRFAKKGLAGVQFNPGDLKVKPKRSEMFRNAPENTQQSRFVPERSVNTQQSRFVPERSRKHTAISLCSGAL